MKRRQFAKSSLSAGALLGLSGCTSLTKKKAPNLVFVFPDQMRGQAMGFLGEDPVVTPTLDAFAKESLVLPQAVSNYPVCSPFRAMFMTGKYPHKNGVINNCNNKSAPFDCELRESERCWSDVLKDRGYSLGYIGKWHLDSPHAPYIDCKNNVGDVKWNEWCPLERRHGFDYWYAYGTYDYHMNPMYWGTDAPRDGFHFVDQWGPEHEADMAIKYIRNEGGVRDADKPFALVVSMNPPHQPYDAYPDKYMAPYAGKTVEELTVRDNVDLSGDSDTSKLAREHTANYFANVTGVDDQFGRILKALEEAGLEEDTIVVFTSDHGNCIGAHDAVSKNNHFEESMRIPFMVRWPGKIAPRTDSLLLSSPDIYPTLLDLMGHGPAIPVGVQGQSHAPLFLTGQGARPSSQLYMKYKYGSTVCGRRGVRTERYKLMAEFMKDKPPVWELFDMHNDPSELTNIAEERKDIIDQLVRDELIPWLQRIDDLWGQVVNDNYKLPSATITLTG